MITIQIQRADEYIKRLIAASFREYRGRKLRLQIHEPDAQINLNSYWDGGSRSYFVAVQLATMKSCGVPQNGTMFDRADYRESTIPKGVVIVEHSIFCGKDAGLRFHVRADDVNPQLLPGGQS